RWCECNPEVFASKNSSPVAKTPSDGQSVIASSEQEGAGRTPPTKSEASDIPYVLAFSMVMLNTDAFNPNAK
ncbi:Sec7 domain-containing protein, partial [Klebsiella pneumoniae]|uniref:Sec7 domain-containing protein n=1 Tax=Klebsiella pneumoniae TaxID=573 RepID=UPI003A8768CE